MTDNELLNIVKGEIPFREHSIPGIKTQTLFRVVVEDVFPIEEQKQIFFELSGLDRTTEEEHLFEELSRHVFGDMLTIEIIAKLIYEKEYELFEIADELLPIKIKTKGDGLSAVLPLCKLFEMAELSEEHKNILFYMSLFCDAGLQYSEVLSGVRGKYGFVLEEYLDDLIAYGFVKERTDGKLFLPSLVSDLVFYCFGAERDALIEKAATDLKKKKQDVGNDPAWLLKEKRSCFLHMLFRLAYKDGYKSFISTYCAWVGAISIALHDFVTARKYLKKSYDICKAQAEITKTSERKKDYVDSCTRMGWILNIQNDSRSAKKMFEEAYCVSKELMESLGTAQSENDFSTACNNLGRLYKELGDFAKAKAYLETSYEIDEKHLAEPQFTRDDESAFAASCMDLGNLYFETEDYIKAKEYYDRALAMRKKTMEAMGTMRTKARYADCCKKIGRIYYEWNDFPRAKEFLEISFRIYEILIQEEGTPMGLESYAVVCDLFGRVYQEEKDYVKAKELFEKGYAVCKKVALMANDAEEDYQNIAVFCDLLAGVCEEMGLLTLAKEYYTKVFTLNHKRMQKAPTEKSKDRCIAACQELARVLYYSFKDYKGALPCSEIRYAISRNALKRYGTPESIMAHIRSCEFLGNVYMKLQNVKSAKTYYEEAYKLTKKHFGKSKDVDLKRCYAVMSAKLGDAYMEEKAYKKAKKYYWISYLIGLGLERDLNTPQSRKEYAAFSYKLAQACQKLGQTEDAQSYMNNYYFYR